MRGPRIVALNCLTFRGAARRMSANEWESSATRRLIYGIGLLAVAAIIVGTVAFLRLATYDDQGSYARSRCEIRLRAKFREQTFPPPVRCAVVSLSLP